MLRTLRFGIGVLVELDARPYTTAGPAPELAPRGGGRRAISAERLANCAAERLRRRCESSSVESRGSTGSKGAEISRVRERRYVSGEPPRALLRPLLGWPALAAAEDTALVA